MHSQGLPIRVGAANMTLPLITHHFVLVHLTNPANALLLLTHRKSGKCDYWCCLFVFP
jgi:hypothetical protein